MSSPGEWYSSLPVLVRTWGTACFGCAALASMKVLSPALIYLDWPIVVQKFQFWRPLTNFLFLGKFSLPFAMNLLLLVRHGAQLESSTFQGRTADFVYMLFLGMASLLALDGASVLLGVSAGMPFLAVSLVFMLVYVWSREFPNANVSLMGMVTIQAFYLPWAYVFLDVIFGASPIPNLMGIFVGHMYYFLTAVYPMQPGGSQLLTTPAWVYRLVDQWGIAGATAQRPPAPVARPGPAFGGGQRAGGVGGSPGAPAAPSTPSPPGSSSSTPFRGRSYRLNRD
eukprot:TRINITY_DN13241_c0_g1_i1.p1 TRINITY_DN13241_c0_g1~~TRINITY_DN13241_c0_g1_i1.p1  ORF type:complete len:282 (-),score=47.44 TRINITY_DN13241_c0_g1_i1:757-1602(-)